MQTKIIFYFLCFFMASGIGYAQKSTDKTSIISDRVAIKKYHNKPELERLPKGQLLGLYVERIESLVKLFLGTRNVYLFPERCTTFFF